VIYVFDNHQCYSAHTIYFVEADDNVPESVVLEILREPCSYGYTDPEGFIAFRAKEVEWRKGSPTSLSEYLTPTMLTGNLQQDEALSGKPFPWCILAEAVPASLVRQAMTRWNKTVENPGVNDDYRQYVILQLTQIAKRYGIKWKPS